MEPIVIIFSYYALLIAVGVFLYFDGTNLFRRQPQVDAQEVEKMQEVQEAQQAYLASNALQERLDQIGYTGEIPALLQCPISRGIMTDPVTIESGVTYNRYDLLQFLKAKDDPETFECPMTFNIVYSSDAKNTHPNVKLKAAAESFVADREKEYQKNQAAQAESSSAPVQKIINDKPETLDGLRAVRAAFFIQNGPVSSGLIGQQPENDVAECRDRRLGR